MHLYIALAALFAVALSQKTYYCPAGWTQEDFGGKTECIYFGDVSEQVTKEDAGVLCAARGGWLLDMDEGRGPAKNNFIKYCWLIMLVLVIGDSLDISGDSNGGSEQLAMDITVNITGEIGPGIMIKKR